jgi:hypothetical protein
MQFLMVFCDFLEIRSHAGPYEKGDFWDEPSIPEPANVTRWVFNHPEEARLLGVGARLLMVHCFSPD